MPSHLLILNTGDRAILNQDNRHPTLDSQDILLCNNSPIRNLIRSPTSPQCNNLIRLLVSISTVEVLSRHNLS